MHEAAFAAAGFVGGVIVTVIFINPIEAIVTAIERVEKTVATAAATIQAALKKV